MEDGFFSTVSIVGVGLIGGSLALALKEKKVVEHIKGFGRNESRLKKAKELNIIDSYSTSLKDMAEAEMLVLATPVGNFIPIIKEIGKYLKKKTVVIDVGSVKGSLVYEIEKILPEGVSFVGVHPIAGSDKTGFEYARKDLFVNSRVIITPTENTDKDALDKVSNLWSKIGATVELMDPYEHDRVYALVSHLPHLASFCLVQAVAEADNTLLKYAGSGFKDTTRIAKSSPELWSDIFLMNSENILNFLEIYMQKLVEIKNLIVREDSDALKKFIQQAKLFRESID